MNALPELLRLIEQSQTDAPTQRTFWLMAQDTFRYIDAVSAEHYRFAILLAVVAVGVSVVLFAHLTDRVRKLDARLKVFEAQDGVVASGADKLVERS